MFKIFSYIHLCLLVSLLHRLLTFIPSLVLLLADAAIGRPYLAVTVLVLLLRLAVAVGQRIYSAAPCTCRVEVNEREEEQATLVAAPVPKDKNREKGGYWDLFGRRPGSPFGSFGGVFGAIHVWNMGTDDGGADRNPFLETPSTDGPVTSTPAEFGPRRLPTGRETELPAEVAGPLARARALARRAFDLWPKKKVDDGFQAPPGLLAASPSASPNEGTPTPPQACSSAVTPDAPPPAPPTSGPPAEPSIPIIRIDPPPEDSPPPARPRPRAASRIGQANRITSLIATSDCRAVTLCKPNTRLTIPLPHIPTPTSPDAGHHTPAHEVLSKIANGLEYQPPVLSEEQKRTLMIYVAAKEAWKERFDRIFPKGGLKEWLNYIATQELLERGNVIEEHINTYGKEGKKNMDIATHNAIVADLEGKGLLKPRLVRLYETFIKENPNANSNQEAWIAHYKHTTNEEKNKVDVEARFKAELEKKAFRAKIVAGKRVSQGAFASAEARKERKIEKAPAAKPKVTPVPVPGTAAARKVSGMRVPAARPVSQERLGQAQEKSIVPPRRPRPLSYNKATPGASSSSKPPLPPAPVIPPKRRLTTDFIASALAKATITTSASPPDKRKELAENKHAHEVLSPYKHVLFPEWEAEAKKGGCKNFLRWLHFRLEDMRIQTLVDDLEPWATANPEGTVDDLVAHVKEQGGVEKVKRKFGPLVEHYYFEFKDVHPGGTAREWGEYLEEKMREEEEEGEGEKGGEEKRPEPPVVGVCKVRVRSPPRVNTRGAGSADSGVKPPTSKTTRAVPSRRPVTAKSSPPSTARPSPLPRPTKAIVPPKPINASRPSTISKLPAPTPSRLKTSKATKENVQPIVPPKPTTTPKASIGLKLPTAASGRLKASKATKENIRPSGASSAATAPKKTLGQVIGGVKEVLGERKTNIPPPRPVIRLCRNHTEYEVQEMDFTRDPGPAPRSPMEAGARRSFGYKPPPIPAGRGGWR